MLSSNELNRVTDIAWTLVNQFASQDREVPVEANRGAQIIADHLRAAGLPVQMHQPELYLSLPKTAQVQIVGGKTLRAKPPAFTLHCPQGITGDLIYLPDAGGGTPLDRSPAALGALAAARGKIAVIEGFALPNFIAGLEAAGAIGAIVVNPGVDIHWGTVSTIWGTPELPDLARLPKIPSVAVNQPDGQALIALAQAGGQVVIRTELETGWFPQYLPVVEIPGKDSEDFVLLHGHYDSWREGVGDNGTGNACMLAVALALWQQRGTLKRGVRIAWWPGHSTGRYGGSAWFADTFARDLDRHCVAHLNCDSPGCRWATSYAEIACTAEAAPYVSQVVADVAGQVACGKRPQRNSDYTFNNIGVTGLFNASSNLPPEVLAEKGYYVVGGCGGNIAWHTENDTIEIADRDVLQKDIALYFAAVAGLAQADQLPFDWRLSAAEYVETIAQYQAACAFDLTPAAQAAGTLAAAIDALYAQDLPPAVFNDKVMALSRLLIPAHFTRGPRFSHDPALNVPPLPAIADAMLWHQIPADQQGFLRAQLMRGQNRLVDVFARAAQAVAL
ncbi:putative peptidase (plasmid) [Ketogulonicigenium vulgare Y25]|uniref:Carboxypeptidase Q n=1 Tax=Ketogulonicigenium vulgare (strain WSH-001) TaxID=759362 RepID=F9YBR3_KETVW|nr:M28 family peptidase [Ketogulonicigenium vulgare]ADO44378.1 putative peptidase [Ketogulonicigenium vulgare Y25]AEM42815.1 Peptidase, M28 family protein [Ketogulonicigenium vulgare WSH-001]ALJ82756.1 peptidase M28 [Ketogulonicigenium vulgare]